MNDTFNLKKLTQKLAKYEDEAKEKLTENYSAFDYYLSLYAILNNIYPTYLAPAYHLEEYSKLLDDPYSSGMFNESIKGKKVHSFLRIEFQETIMSIKALLDRIVKLVAIKYKGVSTDSTFGRFDKTKNKGRGLMSFAYQMADRDEFMARLIREYELWISKAVLPRDKVVHYNDMPIIYKTTFDTEYPFLESGFTIVHLDKNLREGVDIENTEQVDEIAYDRDNLLEFVQNLYNFFDYTIEVIMKK